MLNRMIWAWTICFEMLDGRESVECRLKSKRNSNTCTQIFAEKTKIDGSKVNVGSVGCRGHDLLRHCAHQMATCDVCVDNLIDLTAIALADSGTAEINRSTNAS